MKWLGLLTGALSIKDATFDQTLDRLSREDWQLIRLSVQSEQLEALIYANLHLLRKLERLPDDFRGDLHTQYAQNQNLLLVYAYTLARLKRTLEKENIPFRLLKGMAISSRFYPDPFSRGFGDIDLWIQIEDIGRAGAILEGFGLKAFLPDYSAKTQMSFGEHHFLPDDPAGLQVEIDLHWHLTNPWLGSPLRTIQPVPEQELFERPEMVTITGQPFPTLTPTDTLYHLCLHARAGHVIVPWNRLIDIHFVARSGLINWEELNNLSRKSNTQTILWRTFDLIDQAFDSNYNAQLAWKPGWIHRFLIEKVLYFPGSKAPGKGKNDHNLNWILGYLVLLPDLKSLVKLFSWLIWPPEDWFQQRYNLNTRANLIRGRFKYLAKIPLLVFSKIRRG